MIDQLAEERESTVLGGEEFNLSSHLEKEGGGEGEGGVVSGETNNIT